MKRQNLFAIVALLALPLASHAIEVEFHVPVELKNIDGAADYIEVDCAQWWPEERRRNAGHKTRAELKGEFSKSFSGIVKVVQPWPGTIVPTGKYICTLLIRSTANPSNYFELMPSAATYRYYAGFPGYGVTPPEGVAAAAKEQCVNSIKGEWTGG